MLNRLKDFIVSMAVRDTESSTPVFSESLEREYFESDSSTKIGGRFSRNRDNTYMDEYVETMWQGWLMCAKRNHREELIRRNEQRIMDSAI